MPLYEASAMPNVSTTSPSMEFNELELAGHCEVPRIPLLSTNLKETLWKLLSKNGDRQPLSLFFDVSLSGRLEVGLLEIPLVEALNERPQTCQRRVGRNPVFRAQVFLERGGKRIARSRRFPDRLDQLGA